MRGYEDDPANRVNADAVFYPLMSSLGVADEDIPPDPADQARLYHEVMNQLAAERKPVLVWLENVSDPAQLDRLGPPALFTRWQSPHEKRSGTSQNAKLLRST